MREQISQMTLDQLRQELYRLIANGKTDCIYANLLRGEIARREARR